MKTGRPRKIRMKKPYKRRRYGMLHRGARTPKQLAASVGRRRVRKARRR